MFLVLHFQEKRKKMSAGEKNMKVESLLNVDLTRLSQVKRKRKKLVLKTIIPEGVLHLVV